MQHSSLRHRRNNVAGQSDGMPGMWLLPSAVRRATSLVWLTAHPRSAKTGTDSRLGSASPGVWESGMESGPSLCFPQEDGFWSFPWVARSETAQPRHGAGFQKQTPMSTCQACQWLLECHTRKPVVFSPTSGGLPACIRACNSPEHSLPGEPSMLFMLPLPTDLPALAPADGRHAWRETSAWLRCAPYSAGAGAVSPTGKRQRRPDCGAVAAENQVRTRAAVS